MINLLHGDCLELMKDIPDNSIDMVLCDPPYGTTACKWDTVIDFELMWSELKRITKDNGAICLFGSEPFSSALRMSNIKMFKYDWVWEKERPTNFQILKKQVGKVHELISVFYLKQCFYAPVMEDSWLAKERPRVSGKNYNINKELNRVKHTGMAAKVSKGFNSKKRYPRSVIKFNRNHKGQRWHPTQKPVALLEYLIKTYTLENETVLDFTMGSGSTGVACKNLDRKFIGIEKDEKYFKIAKERIEN